MPDAAADFTTSQWEVLKAAPAHVFALVAGADSLTDKREWMALLEFVHAAQSHHDSLVRALMERVAPDLADAPTTPPVHDFALDGLRAVTALLAAAPDAGNALREALFALGAAVAEASGAQPTRTFSRTEGLRWVRSSGTSATEQQALRQVAEALGL